MVAIKISERVVIMVFVLKENIRFCSSIRKQYKRNSKKWFMNIYMIPWGASEILRERHSWKYYEVFQ